MVRPDIALSSVRCKRTAACAALTRHDEIERYRRPTAVANNSQLGFGGIAVFVRCLRVGDGSGSHWAAQPLD
jgi:hypothetical protein